MMNAQQQWMLQYPQSISLSKNQLLSLSCKKLSKPLYIGSVTKYRNKQTKQECEVVHQCQQIGKVMEYNKMADFYVANPINNKNIKYKENFREKGKQDSKQKGENYIEKTEQRNNEKIQLDILEMKELLKNKILGNNVQLNSYQFLATPTQFLKSFNQTLPTTDLLINKHKANKSTFTSKNISFSQSPPQGPSASQLPSYIKSLQIYPKIVQYIEKRPCWLRNVLEYQLRLDGFKGKYTISQLKNILKYLCYTYRDGPYKHVFCRFGYNPAEARQAIIYQILIVKIKSKEVEDYEEKNVSELQEEEDNNVYDPSFREIPTRYLRIYQLCDIDDPRIQKLIKQATIISEGCNKDIGWFGKNQYAQLLRIAKSIREERSKNGH